jgi:hypothetical protein
MAVFADSNELMEVLMELWKRIKADPKMNEQLLKARMCVRFRYREPEGILTVDTTDGKEMVITPGPTDVKPTVEMSMKSDVAHEFWLGRISAPVAILTGKIVSKGPTPKALALLPAVKPAFSIYSKIWEDRKKALITK